MKAKILGKEREESEWAGPLENLGKPRVNARVDAARDHVTAYHSKSKRPIREQLQHIFDRRIRIGDLRR